MGIALYGMTREAATNIVRHASASEALISLKFNADTHLITLVVEDDGKGFSYDETNTDKHGLMGISERAKILDGHMETSQSSLGGFKLNVVIPFGEKTVDAND